MRALVVLALVGFGCGGARVPAPAADDVARVQGRFPDASLASLEQGRDLYQSRCSRCHVAYAPTTYTADQWPLRIAEMSQRAGISAAQERLILHYLSAISERPTSTGANQL